MLKNNKTPIGPKEPHSSATQRGNGSDGASILEILGFAPSSE